MTIEEAKSCIGTIEMLQRLAYNIHGVMDVVDADNCKNIIKALEQEPCEDCISRQAVLDAINTYDKFGYTETGCFVREPEGDYVPYIHYDDVIKCIKNAPSVTPKEKTRKGEWLRMSDLSEQEDDRYKCSHCGNVVHYRNKMNLYIFNSWCGRCGSDNGRKIEVEL